MFQVLTLFMVYFFRDPERVTPADRNAFYAPADGKIIRIKESEENELLNARALMISIFMSPLNVHVNRVPADGTVKEVKYFPGKFLQAFKDEASHYNEHITMLYETEHGNIVLKQIAGSVARRAVCRVKPGDKLKQGDRYGIIKFSSRIDMFLPLDTAVKVQLNDKVKAGETILATRKN
jgi:phosphatidylserine decarboxylase